MFKFSGFSRNIANLAILIVSTLVLADCAAQRPRFGDFFQAQPSVNQGGVVAPPTFIAPQGFGAQGGVIQGGVIPGGVIQGGVIPGGVIQGGALPGGFIQGPLGSGPATIAAPVFDPFRSNTQALPFGNLNRNPIGAANTAPSLQFAPQNLQVLPPLQPQVVQPQVFQPQSGVFGQPGPQGFAQPQFGGAQFGQPQFQSPFQAQPLFGGGGFNFPRTGQSGSFFKRFREDYLPRLLERPRIRHTFISGDNGNELQINDTEFATTLTFPRFLFVQQPVRITPGFIAHFWDGPVTAGPFGTGFDIPETAFSAFLSLEHTSDPSRRAGVESNFTVGVYSDYEHLDSDSLRLTGVGLGWLRINETNIFKFGAEYFDRLDLKLLPAFGLFIQPTNDLQLDLYFPRPKISQRLPSFRSLDTWLYISGEYGGGNWTVERTIGDDRIDINDYRAVIGIEWFGQRGVTGFAETGYVFDRELVSQLAIPSRTLELQDAILVRLGVEF